MKLYKIFLLGFLLSCNHTTINQNIPKAKDSAIIDMIPFELTDDNNISVRGIFNKVDTLNLMLHTAAGSIALIEEATQNMKSIIWAKEYDVKSWGGSSSARYSENNLLEIGELKWEKVSIWEDKHSGPKTDGKFGLNLFEGKAIEIDFDKKLLTIHSMLPNKIEEFEKLKLIYEDDFMFIEGESIIGERNYKNRFLIHSGYGGTVLYDDKFVESSKIGTELEIIDESELKDSYGNVLKTKKALLPTFKIGETVLKNIPVGFFEGAIGRQNMSVLGGNVLKRFNLIIDADRKHIYLKENMLMSLEF